MTNSSDQPRAWRRMAHPPIRAVFTSPTVDCGDFDTTPPTHAAPVLDPGDRRRPVLAEPAFHITVGAPPLPVIQLTPALTRRPPVPARAARTTGTSACRAIRRRPARPGNRGCARRAAPMSARVAIWCEREPELHPAVLQRVSVPPEIAPLLCTATPMPQVASSRERSESG